MAMAEVELRSFGTIFFRERRSDFFSKNVSRNEKKIFIFSKCKHLIVSDHLNFFPRKKLFDFPFFRKSFSQSHYCMLNTVTIYSIAIDL